MKGKALYILHTPGGRGNSNTGIRVSCGGWRLVPVVLFHGTSAVSMGSIWLSYYTACSDSKFRPARACWPPGPLCLGKYAPIVKYRTLQWPGSVILKTIYFCVWCGQGVAFIWHGAHVSQRSPLGVGSLLSWVLGSDLRAPSLCIKSPC